MNHANLTARYRPQTFADAAGQDTLRAILSRAAAEDKVAPAYLFSGTRGVGKTTLARVFAKALNCMHAPAAEPCNACERCRQITQGTAVDVVEIDGASNRGIDDVRRLKEVVGYAPMDGRYKVFIIDEAHMLSRDAFNALLKTLEEPPARVTFIMATTEAHKFPATILSRCQHYVFKRLAEPELEKHLTGILRKEQAPFDEAAVRLIARRAAGSVRDGMSLLGQVLALGGERLTEADTQRVLGLAGQELFFRLFAALQDGDSLAVTALVREMLDGGLDLGFFLRELALVWRNVFMLKQAGEAAMPTLDLPEAEARRWLDAASGFSLTHVHAAWQMALDGQRRVLTSLEPGLALELLLLNLALLPRLLPIEQLSGGPRQTPAGGGSAPGSNTSGQTGNAAPSGGGQNANSSTVPTAKAGESGGRPSSHSEEAHPDEELSSKVCEPEPLLSELPEDPYPVEENSAYAGAEEPPYSAEDQPPSIAGQMPSVPSAAAAIPEDPQPPQEAPPPAKRPEDCSWAAFMRHAALQEDLPPGFLPLVRTLQGELQGNDLALTPTDTFMAQRLAHPEVAEQLRVLARGYYGEGLRILVQAPSLTAKSPQELKEEVQANPCVQMLMQEFNARLMAWEQVAPECR